MKDETYFEPLMAIKDLSFSDESLLCNGPNTSL